MKVMKAVSILDMLCRQSQQDFFLTECMWDVRERKESRMTPAKSNLTQSVSNLPGWPVIDLQAMSVTNHGKVQPNVGFTCKPVIYIKILRVLYFLSTISPA